MKPPIVLILLTVLTLFFVVCTVISGCQKLGVSGHILQLVGDWAQVRLPPGCIPKQVAAEEGGGVVVLCEDGRVFH